ncbi:glycosyltransferase family 4 protein [Halobacillus ihumii]|uniref:glycosyltransferase family 4 protein n=1 Tax=Halobacillus ihumii TaxID=2686092 RepID=UPI0013D633EA|nr:glycosyltransferase family 4 protein [Halobacillus ihumii]
MNFIILTHQYPKKGNLYRSGFVHQRVTEYIKKGYNTDVWVLDNNKPSVESYTFEGVNVYEGNTEAFNNFLEKNIIHRVLVHFLLEPTIYALSQMRKNIPVLIWVHLYEATSWERRLFDFEDIKFLKYIKDNIKLLRAYKRFNENTKLNVTYIFVSKWIKNTAEKDIKTKFSKTYIIHNYINGDLYNYVEKSTEQRKKILSIRTFQSKKYANDITAKVIKLLSNHTEFQDLEFALYGKGKHFNKIQKSLTKFSNVKMHNTFLSQGEISKLHKEYGLFICPTRQDSQGVSMCEAMSSGLVPITSNNTAIPEFVKQNETGILGNNSKQMADSILNLYNNPEKFIRISKSASENIITQSGLTATIEKELNAIINSG